MKKIILISVLISLTGCGKIDRMVAGFTGNASEVCQGGVVYLQFTSGVSVKYNRDGKIVTCDN